MSNLKLKFSTQIVSRISTFSRCPTVVGARQKPAIIITFSGARSFSSNAKGVDHIRPLIASTANIRFLGLNYVTSKAMAIRSCRLISTTKPACFQTTSTRSAKRNIVCPTLAESLGEGDIKFEKQVGDMVTEDDLLVSVKTDKTSIPINSPVGGKIVELLVDDNSTVKPGQNIMIIDTDFSAAESGGEEKEAAKEEQSEPLTPPPTQQQKSSISVDEVKSQSNQLLRRKKLGGFFRPISKFLDAKNDVAFKRIFGTERNKEILIHFLNDILQFKGANEIKEVEFLSTILDPEIAAKKQSDVDVLCKDSNGVQYICEMQVAKTKGFEKRAQYYAAKAYSRQAGRGDPYHNLKEIIFISIADCIILEDKKEYMSSHVILDDMTHENNLKNFYFVFIELPKFTKTEEDELENIVEKWIYFFKYADETSEKSVDRIAGDDKIIKLAYEELNRFNWTDRELIAYEQEIKRMKDEQAVLEYKLDQAFEKGFKEGLEEARKEHLKRESVRNVAKNLLKANFSIDMISQATGLSIDEIKQIK